jgi:hypothetical protein
MQTALRIVPCTSITRWGEFPATWCSSSMFCVISAVQLAPALERHERLVPRIGLRRPCGVFEAASATIACALGSVM